MPQIKPYNPHTKYGRKKIRQQALQYSNSLPREERKNFNLISNFFTIIVLAIICAFIFLTSGSEGLLKWLSH